MRKISLFVLLFCIKLSFAQSNFEGKIELKMSTDGKPDMGKTIFYFSEIGGRIETEMKFSPNMKPFKTIRIYKKQQPNLYYVLNEAAASYSITDLSQLKSLESTEQEVTIKHLGNEKLHNLNCAHILIAGKGGDTEMWTTKELMDFDSYKNLNESDARARNSSFAKALIKANAEGFPVKTVKKNSKGTTITIELIQVERKSNPAHLFEVPAEYVKTETPSSGLEGVMQEIKQLGDEAIKVE